MRDVRRGGSQGPCSAGGRRRPSALRRPFLGRSSPMPRPFLGPGPGVSQSSVRRLSAVRRSSLVRRPSSLLRPPGPSLTRQRTLGSPSPSPPRRRPLPSPSSSPSPHAFPPVLPSVPTAQRSARPRSCRSRSRAPAPPCPAPHGHPSARAARVARATACPTPARRGTPRHAPARRGGDAPRHAGSDSRAAGRAAPGVRDVPRAPVTGCPRSRALAPVPVGRPPPARICRIVTFRPLDRR